MHDSLSTQAESVAVLAAKATPPVSVSVASFMGLAVSDLVLWATLVYTVLMVVHKLVAIYKDVRSNKP